MRMRLAILPILVVGAVATVPPLTDDDGADTRESGTVVVIGPPPPGGGGSVSAIGTGCTTRGATTKLPDESVIVDVDRTALELPEITAGVTRIVVRNFDDVPHGLVLTELGSTDALPLTDEGFVDEEALPNRAFRIAEFPGNTICEGTFELPAGDYVVFSPSPEDPEGVGAAEREPAVASGVVAQLTVAEPAPDAVTSSVAATTP